MKNSMLVSFMLGMVFDVDNGIMNMVSKGYDYRQAKDVVAAGMITSATLLTVFIMLLVQV